MNQNDTETFGSVSDRNTLMDERHQRRIIRRVDKKVMMTLKTTLYTIKVGRNVPQNTKHLVNGLKG